MAEAKKYYALLTEAGQAAMLKAVAFNLPVRLTHMAVGTANNQEFLPTEDMTSLVHEVHRAPINTLEPEDEDAGLLAADMIIPNEVGGWKVRELGIFDESGSLFAVASVPPTYKPRLQEGGPSELRFRMLISLDNADHVELIIDPTVVLATRDFVEKHTKRTDDPHNTLPEGGEEGQTLIKQADGSLAWGNVGGVPVGQICWSTFADALPGTITINTAREVSCAAYPQLFKSAQEGGNIVTKAEWMALQATQNSVPKYYYDEGSDVFGLPLIRDYISAARPLEAGKDTGDWADAGVGPHTHAIKDETGVAIHRDNVQGGASAAAGIFGDTPHDVTAAQILSGGAEENRPKTSYLVPCLKAFDVAINSAEVDLKALAETMDKHARQNALPAGAIGCFAVQTPPAGWLKCDGRDVSRTTYAGLFTAIGTIYGAGDGTTTFALPDLRGEFIRGWDDGRGADAGRAFGSWQDDELRRTGVTIGIERSDNGHHDNPIELSKLLVGHRTGGYNGRNDYTGYFGGAETRPRNIAMLYCIKAFDVAANIENIDVKALSDEVEMLAQQVSAFKDSKVDHSEWVELVPDRAWKMPNGLIFQTAPTGSIPQNAVVTFPVAFSRPPFTIILGDGAGSNANAVFSFTETSFTVDTTGSAQAYYLAIGR